MSLVLSIQIILLSSWSFGLVCIKTSPMPRPEKFTHSSGCHLGLDGFNPSGPLITFFISVSYLSNSLFQRKALSFLSRLHIDGRSFERSGMKFLNSFNKPSSDLTLVTFLGGSSSLIASTLAIASFYELSPPQMTPANMTDLTH